MSARRLLQGVSARCTPRILVYGARPAVLVSLLLAAVAFVLLHAAPAPPAYGQSPDEGFNPGVGGIVFALAVQADGQILVGGSFGLLGGQPRQKIGRLNPDGTLDTAFNAETEAGTVRAIAIQADGKIVVGGTFTTLGGQARSNVGRLNPDGTPDATFNLGTNGEVSAIAIQADGKIVVGGTFTALGGQARSNVGRLNLDGTLDATFNPGTDGQVSAIAVQADGKIVVGGIFITLGGQPRLSIGRLNPDGTLDPTFDPGVGGMASAMAVQADNKIVVGGTFAELGGQPADSIGRLNPAGTVDAIFKPGTGGRPVLSLAVQPDGKIVVGGIFDTLNEQPRKNIGRLNPGGTLDATFNPGVTGDPGVAAVWALAVQADGKILVGGLFNTLGGKPRANLGRLNTDAAAASLGVNLRGPLKFVPGSVEEYAVVYENGTTQMLENAVLVVALPSDADYLDDNGGGILWPQRRQLFWKLGSLAPGTFGLVSFRVRFLWGIPIGTRDAAAAVLSGTNLDTPGFNVQPYLAFTPTIVVGERALTQAEVQAERQAYSELDQLYSQATQEGFTLGVANSLTFNAGDPMTEIVLLRFEPNYGVVFLRRQGTRAQATLVDSSSYVIRTTRGVLSYNFETDGWETVASGSSAGSLGRQASATFSQCFYNCIVEKVPKHVVKNVVKGASTVSKAVDCYKAATGRDELDIVKCAQIVKKIPGVSEGIDLGKCNLECQENPDSHICTVDKYFCDSGDFPYGWFGIDTKRVCRCITDPSTGRAGQYMPCETYQVCAICEKCVDSGGGPACVTKSGSSQAVGGAMLRLVAMSSVSGGHCSECVVAKDPNAKYGAEGDVFPGQPMTYTITFENEGAGDAFGVFVTDKLPEQLDTSTLKIGGGGEFSASSNTLTWSVGQLAPKGQVGSTGAVSFTVRLKPNLPSGTVVLNQAVVHFPSVPEDTPTNPVVNVVQPLAAIPQELETVADQPVSIRLQGRSANAASLSYVITEQPLNGQLTGTAPDLTYTPAAGFTGPDRLRFTVSDGSTTSRSDEVRILVRPSPADTTAPRVVWTAPQSGGTIPRVVATPQLTDTVGPLYLPAIQIEFSETISATTVTTNTVRMTDGSGRALPIRVSYDGMVNQATVLAREPLRQGAQYTVTVTGGVKDLMGNSLAADYVWSFRTGGSRTYLPFISK